MKRETALIAKEKALNAIKELHSIMQSESEWNLEENASLKKAIGLSMGYIDTKLLSLIYKEYPELDDLT